MATLRWYLTNGVDANGWQALSLTTQSAATLTAGWVVSTGATNSSEHNSGAATDRAATTFVGNTVPDGTLDTSLKDAFRTPALIGTFANANWTFQFAVIATVTGGTAPSGQMVFRLIKANADGSSPTLITASQQSASICTSIGSTAINGTLTFNPGAITLTAGQYLFVQCAWKRTGAGSMTTHNTRLRTGNSSTVGTTILSSDFTPGDQAVTTQPIASTSALNLPTVINTKLVTTDTIPVGSAAITGHVLTPVVSGQTIYSTARVFYTETLLFEHSRLDSSWVVSGPPAIDIAQTILGHTGVLVSISFYLSRNGFPVAGMRLEVREGTHNGALLALSVPVYAGAVNTVMGWVNFALPSGVLLNAGTTYWVFIAATGATGPGAQYNFASSNNNGYASGGVFLRGGSSGGVNDDLNFRLYTGTSHTIVPGAVTGTGATIGVGSAVYEPEVVPSGGGAQAITTATINVNRTVAIEGFNYPDEFSIFGWQSYLGGHITWGNEVVPSSTNVFNNLANNNYIGEIDDLWSQLEIRAMDGQSYGGPTVRQGSDIDDSWYAYVINYGSSGTQGGLGAARPTSLLKCVAGTVTQMGASVNVTLNVGDRIRIEAEGTTIRGTHNGTTIIEVTDSSLTDGHPGIITFYDDDPGGRPAWDNWAGGDFVKEGASKVFAPTVAHLIHGAFIEPNLTDYAWLNHAVYATQEAGSFDSIIGGSWSAYVGQEFDVGAAESLTSIDLRVARYGSPTDNVFVEIRSGGRDGSVIATSASVDAMTAPHFSTFSAFLNFSFATPVPLTPGTLYAWVAKRDGVEDLDNQVLVMECFGSTTENSPLRPGRVDYSHGVLLWDADGPWWDDGYADTYSFEYRLLYAPTIYAPEVEAEAAEANLLTGLVSYWPMDESSGTRADSHGPNDLSDVNTVASATGHVYSLAADLEASNSEELANTSATGISRADENYTGMAWFKSESSPASISTTMVLAAAYGGSGWIAGIYRTSLGDLQYRFFESGSGTGNQIVVSTVAPDLGAWHLMVWFHDATNNLIGISVDNETPVTFDTGAGNDVVYGDQIHFGALFSSDFFDGLIGPAAWWSRVLTGPERSALWNGGAGLTYDELGEPPPPADQAVTTTGIASTLVLSLPTVGVLPVTWVQTTPIVKATNVELHTIIFYTPPTVGNGIIIPVITWHGFAGYSGVAYVTDTEGNVFDRAVDAPGNFGSSRAQVFYTPILWRVTPPYSVTINFGGPLTGFMGGVIVGEESATAVACGLEVTNVGRGLEVETTVGQGANTNGTTASTGTSAASTVDDLFTVAAVTTSNALVGSITVASVSPPWVQVFEELPATYVMGEVDMRTLAAQTGVTQSASWTLGTASRWAAVLAAFKTSPYQLKTAHPIICASVALPPSVVGGDLFVHTGTKSTTVQMRVPTVALGSAPAALAKVQTTAKVALTSQQTSITIPFATPPTVGNGIVIPIGIHAAGVSPVPPVGYALGTAVDSNGQYLSLSVAAGSFFNEVQPGIYYLPKLAAVTAPYSVTISFNGFLTRAEACGIEVTNVGLGLLPDTTATTGASGASTTSPATGASNAATVDTLFVTAVWAAFSSFSNLGAITVESVSPPWTQEYEELANFYPPGEAVSRVLTGQTGLTQSCSWTTTNSSVWAAVLTAFRASPDLVVGAPHIASTRQLFKPTPAGGAPTRVVHTERTAGTSSGTLVSWSAGFQPFVGDGIVITFVTYDAAGTYTGTATCTDSEGNIFTQAATVASAAQTRCTVYYWPRLATLSGDYNVFVSFGMGVSYVIGGINVNNVKTGLVVNVAGGSFTNSVTTTTPSTGGTAPATADSLFDVAVVGSNGSQASIVAESVTPAWQQTMEELSFTEAIGEADCRTLIGQTGLSQSCSWTFGTARPHASLIVGFQALDGVIGARIAPTSTVYALSVTGGVVFRPPKRRGSRPPVRKIRDPFFG